MKKKGQVTIGDLSGLMALLMVAAFIIIAEMQFRGWEKVTKQLESDHEAVMSKLRVYGEGQVNNYGFLMSGMELIKGNAVLIKNNADFIKNNSTAINHNADLYEQLLHGVRHHVKSIHYGSPTRAEEAKRKVRKILK